MNQSIWDDIKQNIIYGNNSLIHLIAINVVLFLFMAIPLGLVMLGGVDAFDTAMSTFGEWLFLPGNFTELLIKPWTLITHFFLHSFSIQHILWNMVFLWMFGRIFHNLMGNQRTIQLYVLAGIAGGLAFMIAAYLLPTLSNYRRLVGASGAVMGFVIATTTLTPQYSIRLFLLGNIKLWWIASFFVITDLIFISENTGGRIAHLFGGLMGYIFVSQLRRGNDLGAWISKTLQMLKYLGSRKPKSQFKTHRNTEPRQSRASGSSSQRVSQEEIDAVLDKIKESGYESLTEHEKNILFRASN